MTADLARQVMEISRETSRQIGLIINRRGIIEYVIVGDNHRIEIPPLKHERTGRARFRGVRFIHTHLRGELLSREDVTDLALLQLDLVACITEMPGERGETIHAGYLVPENKGGRTWDFMEPVPVSEFDVDFTEFITELENEFVKERGRFYVTKEKHDRCMIVSVVLPRKEKNVEIGRHARDKPQAKIEDHAHRDGGGGQPDAPDAGLLQQQHNIGHEVFGQPGAGHGRRIG